MTLDDIVQAIQRTGLISRGGFYPSAEDRLPPLPSGAEGRTLLLLGSAGRGAWDAFARSAERARDASSDPLDAWTRRIVAELAEHMGVLALYAFEGPPYWPFQRWAMRAEPVAVSPLGILIHPEFGLWHGYRAALLFGERLELPAWEPRASPCESCAGRPCLSACPVGAFTGSSYRVEVCAAHIRAPAGAMCMEEGCRARDACPVGRSYRYSAEQIRFHMDAFRRARGGAG